MIPGHGSHGVMRQAEPTAASSAEPTSDRAEYSYGADPLQKPDFWHAPGQQAEPLIVVVHRGGWKRGGQAKRHRSDQVRASDE